MMCSKVSSALILTTGLDDFSHVDLAGRGLFRPQSPLDREDAGVAMDARIGWGRVAVSDSWTLLEVGGVEDGVKACGRAKRREFRSRFAVGDSLAVAMAGIWQCGVLTVVLSPEEAGENLVAIIKARQAT